MHHTEAEACEEGTVGIGRLCFLLRPESLEIWAWREVRREGAEIVVLSLLFAVSCKYRKVWTVPEARGDVAKSDQPEDHQPSSTMELLCSFQYNNTFCCDMCTEQILPSLLCLSRHLRDSAHLLFCV